MLHQKIPLTTQRQRSNIRLDAEKPLVVRVEGYTVLAAGIVIHKTEIIAFFHVCCFLHLSPEDIKTGRDRPGRLFVFVFWGLKVCFGV